MNSFFQFIQSIIWPCLIFFLLICFRQEFKLILLRITSVNFAGNVIELAGLDQGKLKKAEKIRSSTSEPKGQATQLIQQDIIDISEFRILRGLVGEDKGRTFSVYQTSWYYKSAIASLQAKRLVHKQGKKYFLTSVGWEVIKLHLSEAISSSKS